MTYTIIIPARMHSTRLPQKMMRHLDGMPLIERTWRQAKESQIKTQNQIIIATDHDQILTHMLSVGADVIMTNTNHHSGTDRLSEVAEKYQFEDDHIIVNWQGDEPFLPPELLAQIVQQLIAHPDAAISTLGTPIHTEEALTDPNIVKVVTDRQGLALYFSRAPIPYPRDSDMAAHAAIRHLGIYAYRAGFLKQYPHLDAAPLEEIEKLEQLRALYNGFKIILGITHQTPPPGIDTEDDFQNAQKYLSSYKTKPRIQ